MLVYNSYKKWLIIYMAYAISHIISTPSRENRGCTDTIQSWGALTDLVVITLLLLSTIVVSGDQSSNWVYIDSGLGGGVVGLILIDFGTFLVSRCNAPSSISQLGKENDEIEHSHRHIFETIEASLDPEQIPDPAHDSLEESQKKAKYLIEFCETTHLEITKEPLSTGLRDTLTYYFVAPEKEYDIELLNDLLIRTYTRFLYSIAECLDGEQRT